MKGFVDNIEKLTEENDDFRRVLYTGHNLQLVLMAIQPGEEIGEEVHDDRDQFFRIEGVKARSGLMASATRSRQTTGSLCPRARAIM